MTATATKPRVRVPAGGVAFPRGLPSRPAPQSAFLRGDHQSPSLFRWHPALRETSDDVRQAWRLATARTVDQFQNSGWLSGAADISTAHQCFFVSQINGYSEAPDGPNGRDRLYVTTGVNDRWLLEPFAGCPNLNWANNIALNTRSFTTLCTGETAELLVPSGISTQGVDRCTARVLGKVSVAR